MIGPLRVNSKDTFSHGWHKFIYSLCVIYDSTTVAHKIIAHKTVAHKTIAHKTTAHNLNGTQDNCSQHNFFHDFIFILKVFYLYYLYFMGTIFPSKYYVAVDPLNSTN